MILNSFQNRTKPPQSYGDIRYTTLVETERQGPPTVDAVAGWRGPHVAVVSAVVGVEAVTAQRHADAAAVVALQLFFVIGQAV